MSKSGLVVTRQIVTLPYWVNLAGFGSESKAMSIGSLRRVGELIREQRHVLLARWRRQVRQLPSAKNMSVPTLNDHVPQLIDELADALELRTEETIEETLLKGTPPEHGRQRVRDGFDIEEVVAEYNVLRSCVHDLAEEHGLIIQGEDLRVVNRVIDEAIGLAVQTYALQLAFEVKQRREEHITFVAHDLHTPLKAIALTVGAIERTLGQEAHNEATEQLLKILRRNIKQLEKSVIDVMKANGEEDADAVKKVERRDIDLWPLVENVIHGLEPVAATASVEIVNKVPSDLNVYADAGLLSRIFENLIANAINFAPRGKVTVEALERHDEPAVECRISDNGPGIPVEELKKLFDENSINSSTTGDVGLGLPIVKQFVEAHGGRITADSSDGVGPKISFTLPARPQRPPQ
jgi:signal transduction histidine kinase